MRKVSNVVWVACLLAPWSALGQDAGAPVLLDNRQAVRELCLATRPTARVAFEGDQVARAEAKKVHAAQRKVALARLYRLKVPADGFEFGAYDTRERRLALSFQQPLRTLYGAVNVSIPSDTKLHFLMPAEAAAGAVAARNARSASLEIHFLLDASAGAVCAGSVATDVYQLAGRAVSVTLLDGVGAQLARAETPLADDYRGLLGGYSGVPEVKVGVVQADEGLNPEHLALQLAGIVEPVRRCYEARLEEQPSASGVVVLGVAINAQGGVDAVNFIADALGDASLRECVHAAMSKVRFDPIKGLFRVPVELRLAPRK